MLSGPRVYVNHPNFVIPPRSCHHPRPASSYHVNRRFKSVPQFNALAFNSDTLPPTGNRYAQMARCRTYTLAGNSHDAPSCPFGSHRARCEVSHVVRGLDCRAQIRRKQPPRLQFLAYVIPNCRTQTWVWLRPAEEIVHPGPNGPPMHQRQLPSRGDIGSSHSSYAT